MSKQILVNASHYETRVAILEDGAIKNLYIEREEDRNVVGNIYKGVVKRVLPGMQAAFLELGLERTAFLYVDDIIENPLGGDMDYGDDEEDLEDEDNEELDGEEDEDLDEDAEDELEDEGDFDEEEAPDEDLDEEDEPEARSSRGKGDDHDQEEGDDCGNRREARDDRGGRRDAKDDRGRGRGGRWGRGKREARDGNRDEDRDRGESRDRDRGRDRGDERESRDGGRDRDRDRGRGRGGRDRGRDRSDERESRDGGRDRGGRGRGGRQARGRGGRGGGRDRGGRQRRAQRGRRGSRFSRRPKRTAKIQDLIKEGQELLVQVAKAPIGTKGARLTTHLSLPGRNIVLMPTVAHLGISRRIENERERRRLRDLFNRKIRPNGVGFIVRTAAAGKQVSELKADADYLIKLWDKIKINQKKKKAPALIHEDLGLGLRSVRDYLMDDVDSFVIDNAEVHKESLDFIGQFMPRLKSRVKLFKGPSQLFEHHGIEAEISRALGKKVWLKSGGYLLIDQSEALTSIDVNTGRYVGSKSLEETILKTNIEAVKEIAYQLRIRNVGGIIILDLIDMELNQNKEKVFRALQEVLLEDKARMNILKISDLGLIEMTRKRTNEDLVRYLTETCHYCEGRGYHKSRRTVSFEIFREIEKESLNKTSTIVVFANNNVVKRIQNEEKKHVKQLQDRLDRKIVVKNDPEFHVEQYEVFGKH